MLKTILASAIVLAFTAPALATDSEISFRLEAYRDLLVETGKKSKTQAESCTKKAVIEAIDESYKDKSGWDFRYYLGAPMIMNCGIPWGDELHATRN